MSDKAEDRKPVAYLPHPVSAEDKKSFVSKGYKIIDAIFAPKDLPEGDILAKAEKPKAEPAKTAAK